jgi:hypothetical protein
MEAAAAATPPKVQKSTFLNQMGSVNAASRSVLPMVSLELDGMLFCKKSTNGQLKERLDAANQTLKQVNGLSTTSELLISVYTSTKLRKFVSLIVFRVLVFVGLRLQQQPQ